MDGSYVPPFRRHQAAGDSGNAPLAEDTPNNHSYQSTRHDGNRQGHRGYGRGGRGGDQRDFFRKQRSQADQPDLYHPRDIHNYFWGRVDDTQDSHSFTFHGSKDRPEQLSHLLLFIGANPRWANDHIVFAKSKLALLPEYAVKKAENGEWETEKKTYKSAGAATNGLEDGAPKDQDAIVVHSEHGSETVTQADGSTSAEAHGLSSLPVKKQNNLTGEPSGEKDSTASIYPADSAKKDDKSQEVKQEITQGYDQVSAQDSNTGTQELNPSNNGEVEQFASGDNTKCEKRETQYASIEVEGVADHAAHDTPIPTPSSTVTTRRLKYTDIRKEEAENSPPPNKATTSESHMKDTDIRTIPANKFYHEREHERLPSDPVLPTIAPIDYVPTNPLPIAIFEQRQRTRGIHSRFAFKGWFKISRINILAPHSAELVRMLQQKWGRKDRFGNMLPSRPRDASAWNASLAMEWAVIAFQLLEGEDAPPAPQIEKLPEPERPITKSVNEMLSDMRLNDSSGDERKGDHHAMVKLDEDKATREFSASEDTSALDK